METEGENRKRLKDDNKINDKTIVKKKKNYFEINPNKLRKW